MRLDAREYPIGRPGKLKTMGIVEQSSHMARIETLC